MKIEKIMKGICLMCREEIEYIGPYWDHIGNFPRHPAVPLGNLKSIESFRIKEYTAIIVNNPFINDPWEKLIGKRIAIDNKFFIIKGIERRGIKKFWKDEPITLLVEENNF